MLILEVIIINVLASLALVAYFPDKYSDVRVLITAIVFIWCNCLLFWSDKAILIWCHVTFFQICPHLMWETSFYTFGFLGITWVFLWLCMYADPATSLGRDELPLLTPKVTYIYLFFFHMVFVAQFGYIEFSFSLHKIFLKFFNNFPKIPTFFVILLSFFRIFFLYFYLHFS